MRIVADAEQGLTECGCIHVLRQICRIIKIDMMVSLMSRRQALKWNIRKPVLYGTYIIPQYCTRYVIIEL